MENRRVVFCVLVALSLVGLTSTLSLPKSWAKCRQSDPKFNDCLAKAAPAALRKLKGKGVPSLGVFPVDPLDVTEMNVIQGNSGPVNINLVFKNIQIHGIAESYVTEYNATLQQYKIYTRSITPAFNIKGNYIIGGRILLLPIQGKGKCDITLEELDTKHFMTGESFIVDGKEYMRIVDYRITLDPKRFTSHLENLFNGDKQLGEVMNNFMNENWRLIFPELKPSLEASFGELFREMSNRIFEKVPLNEIFLP